MLPPPTTIAISTPLRCTSTISSAIASIVGRSMPYSRSPMSASPDSFSRMREKAGSPEPAGAEVASGTLIRQARSARTRAPRRLRRERLELLVLRDRLGLAADRHHRRVVVGDAVADDALGRLAPGALRSRREPALAQQHTRRLDVAARLLEGALALHHPRAGRVAELLDEAGRDRGHSAVTSWVSGSAVASASGSAVASASSSGSAGGLRCSSCCVTCWRPVSIASPSTRAMRLHARIASSLPGIT